MTETRELLTRVKIINESLFTHLELQRDFNRAWFQKHTPNWFIADTKLDGLRDAIRMTTELQIHLERQLADDISKI